MVGREPRQLQPKIGLHRSGNIRRPSLINRPAPVVILVPQHPVRGFLKSFRIACAEEHVEQNVIGFESSVGLELAAPVTVFVLLREQILARRIHSRRNVAAQIFNFPKT